MKLFALTTLCVVLFAHAHDMNAMCVYNADDSVYNVVANIDSITFENSATETPTTGEPIDIGLSVKWASCNVDATESWEYGGYYAWGETEEKDYYDWSSYKWCNGSLTTMAKYCANSSCGTVDNKTTLEPSDDVAHVKWGGSWRMPTFDEMTELIFNCTWQWTTYKNVNGYEVTGPNGNSIFLPAAGCRSGTEIIDRGSIGFYWSSSLNSNDSSIAGDLFFNNSNIGYSGSSNRCYGCQVRPVCE